jgi:plastocyanin
MTIHILMLLLILLAISSCGGQEADVIDEVNSGQELPQGVMVSDGNISPSAEMREFTLQTGIVEGRMAFVGVGGDIDGIVNPDLVLQADTSSRVTVINGDGMPHDLFIPDLGIKTPLLSSKGASGELSFMVSSTQEGSYPYFCTVAGHRQGGMEGRLLVQSEDQRVSPVGN